MPSLQHTVVGRELTKQCSLVALHTCINTFTRAALATRKLHLRSRLILVYSAHLRLRLIINTIFRSFLTPFSRLLQQWRVWYQLLCKLMLRCFPMDNQRSSPMGQQDLETSWYLIAVSVGQYSTTFSIIMIIIPSL